MNNQIKIQSLIAPGFVISRDITNLGVFNDQILIRLLDE